MEACRTKRPAVGDVLLGLSLLRASDIEPRLLPGGSSSSQWLSPTLEHSKSIYRFFVKHRSGPVWILLRPFAWVALRARAALVSWRRGER